MMKTKTKLKRKNKSKRKSHWIGPPACIRDVACIWELASARRNILRWDALCENLHGIYSYYRPMGVTACGVVVAPVDVTCHAGALYGCVSLVYWLTNSLQLVWWCDVYHLHSFTTDRTVNPLKPNPQIVTL